MGGFCGCFCWFFCGMDGKRCKAVGKFLLMHADSSDLFPSIGLLNC